MQCARVAALFGPYLQNDDAFPLGYLRRGIKEEWLYSYLKSFSTHHCITCIIGDESKRARDIRWMLSKSNERENQKDLLR